jgi:hypothetical protein
MCYLMIVVSINNLSIPILLYNNYKVTKENKRYNSLVVNECFNELWKWWEDYVTPEEYNLLIRQFDLLEILESDDINLLLKQI